MQEVTVKAMKTETTPNTTLNSEDGEGVDETQWRELRKEGEGHVLPTLVGTQIRQETYPKHAIQEVPKKTEREETGRGSNSSHL